MNGLYRVYWNQNDELPENGFRKRTVVKGEIPFHRQFFYGDVFIVRQSSEGGFEFDEKGYQQYSDVPSEILDTPLIQLIFEHSWQEGMLDNSLEQEAESGELRGKWREIETLCPRAYKCDESALLNCSTTNAKPGFVSVNTVTTGDTGEDGMGGLLKSSAI
ncbi:MAG: hypothetical protein M1835_002189, partial [Candelina submexicana]